MSSFLPNTLHSKINNVLCIQTSYPSQYHGFRLILISKNTPSFNELPPWILNHVPSNIKWLFPRSSTFSWGVLKFSGFKWVMLLWRRSNTSSFVNVMRSIEAIDLITLWSNWRYWAVFALWCNPSGIVSNALKGKTNRSRVRQPWK